MSRFKGDQQKPYDRVRPRASDGMWQHDRAAGIPAAVVDTSPEPSQPTTNNKLVVSNLHYNVTPKDLVSIFGQIGTLVREPHIKYDRSGRSTGIAYITFETQAEAIKAKKQFDGILAKGQPMTVAFDAGPPRQPRRASAPPSLVDRIQKRPLLERLSGEVQEPRANGKPAKNTSQRSGPVRNRGGRRGGATVPAKKEVKSVEDLDKELDAFMGDGSTPTITAKADDVEMLT